MGVKEWFAAAPAAAAAKSSTVAPAAPATDTAKTSKAATAPKAAATPAPGGGAGQVWVNTKSRVYHCSGTKYYGTTKQGEYMS